LGDIPESIGSLSLLQTFILDPYEGPIALPLSVSKLTALKHLDFSSAEEGIAPIQHLTCLTKLKLWIWDGDDDENDDDNYPMLDYPGFIWSLTSLKALSLDAGQRGRLPDAVANLKNLESLELCDHDISKLIIISESIGNLSRLTDVSFNNCYRLRTLPESITR